MIYNKDLQRTPTNLDCMKCAYYDKKRKQCKGLGICCFDKTIMGALINPKTKMILKEKKDGK